MESEKRYTCCFDGNVGVESTEALYTKVYDIVEKLITEEKVNTFLFETKKGFEGIGFTIVLALRLKYPHIQRIRVSTGVPFISDFCMDDSLEGFDDTYYPGRILYTEKLVYQGQKGERTKLSGFCAIYDEETGEICVKKA